MKVLWTTDCAASELVVVEDTIVISEREDVVAFDAGGVERWRRSFERPPRHLTRCGLGVSFSLASRSAPTQIVTLDLDGKESWRYRRAWGLHSGGIAGDARGLFLYGQDFGASVHDSWVGFSAHSGVPLFEVRPPVDAAPRPADRWLIAPLDDGNEGILRTDRNGSNETTLTKLAHVASATNGEVLLLATPAGHAPSEIVAIELASGRECWRAPGGNILEIGIDARRAAWVRADGRPVVHELATGTRVWEGTPTPPLVGANGYTTKLGLGALACYCGFTSVAYYSLEATSPLHLAKADGEGAFLGPLFIEPGESSLTCWELTSRCEIALT